MRNWTWRKIIQGIIDEHVLVILNEGIDSELDITSVSMVWIKMLKLGGINELDQVPQLKNPDHKDVKAILIMYSLESFLFKRLNESCRE